MKIKQLAVLVTCVVSTVVALVCGCSLSVPKEGEGHSLIINLQEAQHATLFDKTFAELFSPSGVVRATAATGATGPTSLADFGCYTVDIAGAGIPADSGNQISNCTVASGISVGLIPNPVKPGELITATVPAGPARTIYAFGIGNCDNGSTGTSGGSGSSGTSGGYLIGQVTQDIVADTSVTIPVSYVSGTGPVVTCKENSGNTCQGPNFPSGFIPQGGTTSTTIVINAVGNFNNTTVTVGGGACTNFTAIDSTHFSCQVPGSGTGSQNVQITTACGNSFSAGSYTFTSSDFLYAADNAQFEADGTSFGFGQTNTPITHTFYIVNSGNSVAASLSASVSGTYFSSGTDNCTGNSLSPGTSCTVDVVFTPASTGNYTGSLSISSSGSSANRSLAGSR